MNFNTYLPTILQFSFGKTLGLARGGAIVMFHINSRIIMESGDCTGKTRMIPAGKMQNLFSDFKQTVSTLYEIQFKNLKRSDDVLIQV